MKLRITKCLAAVGLLTAAVTAVAKPVELTFELEADSRYVYGTGFTPGYNPPRETWRVVFDLYAGIAMPVEGSFQLLANTYTPRTVVDYAPGFIRSEIPSIILAPPAACCGYQVGLPQASLTVSRFGQSGWTDVLVNAFQALSSLEQPEGFTDSPPFNTFFQLRARFRQGDYTPTADFLDFLSAESPLMDNGFEFSLQGTVTRQFDAPDPFPRDIDGRASLTGVRVLAVTPPFAAPVPEPATWATVGAGLLCLALGVARARERAVPRSAAGRR
ncbi:MAG: hypothetical protein WCJ69_15165 [Betaproteobacteria bacterium]